MNELSEKTISCPYCGEPMDILVEPEDIQQTYIEDCQVCCRPINIHVTEAMDGHLDVIVYAENDTV